MRPFSAFLVFTILGGALLVPAQSQTGHGFTVYHLADSTTKDANGNTLNNLGHFGGSVQSDGQTVEFYNGLLPQCDPAGALYTVPFFGGPVTTLVSPTSRLEPSQPAGAPITLCARPLIGGSTLFFSASYAGISIQRSGIFKISVKGGAISEVIANGDPLPANFNLGPITTVYAPTTADVATDANADLVAAFGAPANGGQGPQTTYGIFLPAGSSSPTVNVDSPLICNGATYFSRYRTASVYTDGNTFASSLSGVISGNSVSAVSISTGQYTVGCNTIAFASRNSSGVPVTLPAAPNSQGFVPPVAVIGGLGAIQVNNGVVYLNAHQTTSSGSDFAGIYTVTSNGLTPLITTQTPLPGLTPLGATCPGGITPSIDFGYSIAAAGRYLVFDAHEQTQNCTTMATTNGGGFYVYDLTTNTVTLGVPFYNGPLVTGDPAFILNYSPWPGDLTPDGHFAFVVVNSVDAANQPNAYTLYSVNFAQLQTAVSLTAPSTTTVTGGVTLTATVSPNSGAGSAATGIVQFLDGTVVIGSQPIDATGTATLTVNGLTPGPHSITASYSGDTLYQGATSAVSTVTVPASMVLAPIQLGSQSTGSTSAQQTVTVPFHGTVTLGSVNILTQGAPNMDFQALPNDPSTTLCTPGATYSNGQTCTIDVVFKPTAPGTRLGAVVITAADQQSNFTGTAPDTTVFYGGTPYCPYSGTLSLTTLSFGIDQAAGVVKSGQINTKFTELVLNGCGVTTGPPVDNVFTLTSATLNGSQLSAVFSGGAGNSVLLSSTATFNGTLSGNSISGTLTITRGGLQNTNLYFVFTPIGTLSSSGNPLTALPVTTLSTSYLSGTGVGPLGVFTPGQINTIAGSLTATSPGNGGPPLAAQLAALHLTLDGGSNLYFTDSVTRSIRKISNGVVQGFAGNGAAGFAGDGGPATSASFDIGNGNIAIDGAGNMFVADMNNSAIRRIDAVSGIVTTVAGIGGANSSTSGFSGDGGLAINARLSLPETVIVDGAGNVYIADWGNYRVRKVDALTHQIQTIAGIGLNTLQPHSGDGGLASQAGIGAPAAIAFDTSANLYIADDLNCAIRKVDAVTNIITLFAGSYTCGYGGDGGLATSAQFKFPEMIAVDPAGNLFLADEANATIRKVNASTGIISTVAGQNNPNRLPNGTFQTPKPSSGDGGAATAAYLQFANGLALDSVGNLYLTDGLLIREVSTTPAPLTYAALLAGQTSAPQSVLFGNDGNGPLQLSTITPSPNFTVTQTGSTPCSSTTLLAPSAECLLSAAFSPLVGGQVNGSVVLLDNTAKTYTVPLGGMGLALGSSVSVTAAPAVVDQGSPVNFTGLVFAASPISVAPTGTLTFAEGTTLLGTASVTQSSATLNLSTLAAGVHIITVSYSGDATFQPSSFTFTQIIRAIPSISWTAPAGIVYGTPLSATQLNATASSPAAPNGLAGTFVYLSAVGTVLSAGQQALTVVFTPTDLVNYAPATKSVSILVGQATPSIAWAPAVPSISYGTALGAQQLNATATGVGGVPLTGTFVYTPAAGTVLNGGTQTLTVIFNPSNTNYGSTRSTATITVTQAVPTLTWPTPPNLAYGIPVGSTQLNATAAGINGIALPGTYVYTPAAGAVLNPGSQTLSVTFTPTDAVDYTSASSTVTLTISDLTLTTVAPNTAQIGDPAKTITVTGSGFVATTVVMVNGNAVATTYVNPTTLTAVVPATNFTAAAVLQISLKNPSTGSASASQPLTVSAAVPVAIYTGPTSSQPGTQPMVTLSLSAPYPVPLTATFTLTQKSALPSGVVDPAVQFATGGTTYAVTIPAGSTTIPPIQVQSGTVAGTIIIPVVLTANGINVTPSNLTPVTIIVPAAVPALSTTSLARSGKQLSVSVIGFSNTREIVQASFHFTPVAGGSLTTTDITAPVGPAFAAWFADPSSLSFGSAFTYTQNFTVSDDAANIASVQIKLTNSTGVSTTQTAQ